MRKELLNPTPEGEARLLLLISTFSTGSQTLDGRTKLAKLDFLLRYPGFLRRALAIRSGARKPDADTEEQFDPVEERMVRYRYGPWDPSYFATLGRLLGKRLIEAVPTARGIGYRATSRGRQLAEQIAATEPWGEIAESCKVLKKHFNLTGNSLKQFIYDHFLKSPAQVGVRNCESPD